jgi:microcystin degradation protein MlrC
MSFAGAAGLGAIGTTDRPGASHAAETTGRSAPRVFYAALFHETNTFHPQKTSKFIYHDPKPGEVVFPLKTFQQAGVIQIPGTSAYPDGGGTVEEGPCRAAMARIVRSLRAVLPVDGVYLRLHGAMYAEGVGPAESALVEQIRAVVGPKVPIACTFDLHGNIPARLARAGDILEGLKTAPHTDHAEMAEHAARLLLEAMQGKIKPVSYVLPLPVLIAGEKAMTTCEPFRSLVGEARRLEREGVPGHAARILAATIFVGCMVTDSPDTGMSIMITADGSRAAARAAAVHLARKVWDARRQFSFGVETAGLEEGVTRAMAAKESTVFLNDTGDNVTAATPGDLPVVLRHLVERKVPGALVAGIYDEAAARRAIEAGPGKRLRLSIGASVEKRYGPPLEAEVEVVRVTPKYEGMALVRIGQVEAVLCARSFMIEDAGPFRACGIDPLSRKIVVVKQGYLLPELMMIAPRQIMLLTPGCSDLASGRLTYVKRRKPMYPLDPDTTFDDINGPPEG